MGASPWDRWSAVDASSREELLSCMTAGRRHPDDEVADAALGWAEVVIGSHEVARGGPLVRVLFGAMWLLDILLGALDLSGSGARDRRERDWAERVLVTQVRRQS